MKLLRSGLALISWTHAMSTLVKHLVPSVLATTQGKSLAKNSLTQMRTKCVTLLHQGCGKITFSL